MTLLAQKRKEKLMTQYELADAVGVTRQAISNIERGLAVPSYPTAQAIGRVLDIEWSTLIPEAIPRKEATA